MKKELKSILNSSTCKKKTKTCESKLKNYFHHNKKKHHHHKNHNHQQVIVNNNYPPKVEKKTDFVPPNPPSTAQGMHMDVPYSLLLNQKNMYNRLLDNQQKSIGEPVYQEQDSAPQEASAPGSGRKQRSDKGRVRGSYKKGNNGGGGGAGAGLGSRSTDTMGGD